MKKSSNHRAITGLNKGYPIKIKDLNKEDISKGKVIKLEKLWNISDKGELLDTSSIAHANENYFSYTFCSLVFIKVIYDTK